MSKTMTEPRPTLTPAQSEAVARLLEKVAWLMDRAVKIPGTKVTVGLDALFGLLPVGGDVLTGLVQTGLVLTALRHYKVPKAVAAQMMGNVMLDVLVGAIPILGDLFDVGFKANTRNMKLLEPYRHPRIIDMPEHPAGIMMAAPAGERLIASNVVSSSFNERPLAARSGGTSWRFILPIAFVLISSLFLMLIGFVAVIQWLLKH